MISFTTNFYRYAVEHIRYEEIEHILELSIANTLELA